MSKYKRCPNCDHGASGGWTGGAYIKLHRCKDKGHTFCNDCKNGDRCPLCGSATIAWNYDEAYTDR